MKLPKKIKIYGDTSFRDPDCRSESAEQKEFFGLLKFNYPEYFDIAIHPKNEGKRTGKQANIDSLLGALNTGASDVIIPASISFVCEIKRKDHTKSSISDDQVWYLTKCQNAGSFACIALGCDAAMAAFEDWVNIIKNNLQTTCKDL